MTDPDLKLLGELFMAYQAGGTEQVLRKLIVEQDRREKATLEFEELLYEEAENLGVHPESFGASPGDPMTFNPPPETNSPKLPKPKGKDNDNA